MKKRFNYECLGGTSIHSAVNKMIDIAKENNTSVETIFNGIKIVVSKKSDSETVIKKFQDKMKQKHLAYIASSEYKEAEAKRIGKENIRKQKLESILEKAPKEMSFKNKKAWNKLIQTNNDGYGSVILNYAEIWARIMEYHIQQGVSIVDCAEEDSFIADTDGISGYMYGYAIAVLAKAWKYGEELRKWHNLKIQVRDEGEKANKEGGVLNPALLNISVKE